jgi:ATP-binding cassette subfamily F protein uup
LILDEPTNDLDILTLNTLEEFLLNFKGCLIIVTHDRYFLNKLATHLFIFEGQGKIKDFNGLYSEYRDMIIADEKESRSRIKDEIKEVPKIQEELKNRRKASYNEKKEFESLEREIERLEEQKKNIQLKMAQGEGSYEDFSQWSQEIKEIDASLNEKSNRWLELSELF